MFEKGRCCNWFRIPIFTCNTYVVRLWWIAVEALININWALNDSHGILNSWDESSVDTLNWAMITCSSDYLGIGLLVPLSLFLHFLSHSFLTCFCFTFCLCRGVPSQFLSGSILLCFMCCGLWSVLIAFWVFDVMFFL